MNLFPVLKKQSKDYSFEVTTKSNDKLSATFYVYLNEQVLIVYNYVNKSWEYHAIREENEFGLMVWIPNDGAWKRANDELNAEYSNFIAEKALLKD